MTSTTTNTKGLLVLLSGKRKTGKTSCTEIMSSLSNDVLVVALADAIKRQISEDIFQEELIMSDRAPQPASEVASARKNAIYEQLLHDPPFKERHRSKLIRLGEKHRKTDPFYWCKAVTEVLLNEAAFLRAADSSTHPRNLKGIISVVPDCRFKQEMHFFTTHEELSKCFQVVQVRLECPDHLRRRWGWKMNTQVDYLPSEIELDDYPAFDIVLNNDKTSVSSLVVHLSASLLDTPGISKKVADTLQWIHEMAPSLDF